MAGHPTDSAGWTPEGYRQFVAGIPEYEELHHAVVSASLGAPATRILDLGTGSGETAQRLLAAHPDAELTGLDLNPRMLETAAARLPSDRVRLMVGDIAGALPDGPFGLVVSVLAVHHLTAPQKAALFRHVHGVLDGGGLFVLGDAMRTPAWQLHRRAATVAARLRQALRQDGAWTASRDYWRGRRARPVSTEESDEAYDKPDTLRAQLRWMGDAGLAAEVAWRRHDYAVVRATKET